MSFDAEQDKIRQEMENINNATQSAAPETESAPAVEAEQAQPEQVETQQSAPQDEIKEIVRKNETNFRALREKNERLEQELAELKASLSGKQQQSAKEEEDFDLRDDDLTEGKHYKSLKKRNAKLEAQIASLTVETRLRTEYPDIFKVVNDKNLKALAETEPELAYAISSSSDVYSSHIAAYKAIKKLGVGTADPNLEVKERITKNLSKPRSASSVSPQQGESPLAEVDRFAKGLTPELAEQLRREMEEAISNRN